jgi:hypothetical protein
VGREAEGGQATPEWIGVVLLLALALAAAAAAGLPLPGASLGEAIAARLVCAAGLEGACAGQAGPLVAEYGPELAGLVTEHAPTLAYEEGMHALPVDFRSCRRDSCAEGADAGAVTESVTGEPVTAFVHAVDCRDGEAAARAGYDCSGERAGRVYLQYWL